MLRSIKKRLKTVGQTSSGNENCNIDDTKEDSNSHHSSSTHTNGSYFYAKGALNAPSNGSSSSLVDSPNQTIVTKKKKPTKEDVAVEALQKLAPFDACIYAADSLVTQSAGELQKTSILSARRDPGSGLLDCSILVSPDGHLLLIPPSNNKSLWSAPETSKDIVAVRDDKQDKEVDSTVDRTTSLLQSDDDDESDGDTEKARVKLQATTNSTNSDNNQISNSQDETLFSQLIANGRDDYDSAIFFGNDLVGDKALNGFSAKGWSIPATSHALYQTEAGVQALTTYCTELVQSRQEQFAETVRAGMRLRSSHPAASRLVATPATWRNKQHKNRKRSDSFDWELIDPRASDFEHTTERVGPLQAKDSTLFAAIQAIEDYNSDIAQRDSQRYKAASVSSDFDDGKKLKDLGMLTRLKKASSQFSERVARRQQALEETSRKVRLMEDHLVHLKQTSDRSWEAVYQAEARVTKKVEQGLKERSREREKQRLTQLRQQQSTDAAGGALGTTSEEIWDIVAAVAESMENDGSFEPIDLPSAPMTAPQDKAKNGEADGNSEKRSKEEETKDVFEKSENLPVVSREVIEHEVGLPTLRQAAMKADDDINDAAQALLLVLSKLDTTRRSARTAAETCLVAVGNAQAASLKSWIQLERASLEERLAGLDALDEVVDRIDVRSDLDKYITADKKSRGGSSHLGDDDDGGVASALAALSSHVDGIMGHGTSNRKHSMSDAMHDDDGTTLATLDKCLETLFDKSFDSTNDSPGNAKAREEFDEAVVSLCKMALGDTSLAAARRSALCYALNSKRSSNTEIRTSVQFDRLCRVFEAILTGCDSEVGGVSNAKMCIMLAQTFYLVDTATEDGDEATNYTLSPATKARSKRVYIRSRLLDHHIWSKDDFWDEALSQQISEALTQSGVMSNFEKEQVNLARKIRQNSEWAQTRKTKWHDLNSTERVEAASQVHAVVFAQLGALAHSMIEFGCGLERSCVFVRRMCIRHQLPSSHRFMLLKHLMARDDIDRQEST